MRPSIPEVIVRTYALASSAVVAFLLAAPAAAGTLTVGAGKTYPTPCAAVAAANANDVIEIDAATYTDTCSLNVPGITLRGVGGRPKIDLSAGTPSGQKGIYVIDADGITIDNLELTGAHISAAAGENGAGIRIQATNLTIRGCFIHDNQNGILGAPPTLGGELTIESTEFAGNGQGDGCNSSGCTHNLYINENFAKVTFRYNYSHSLAMDTPDKGHLFKSRAQQNFILYNRFSGEGDTDSYEIDLPQGGLAIVVGNMIEKPATSGNGNTLAYAEEGLSNGDNRIFVAFNTFVTNHSGGSFLNITNGGVLVAHDNIFVGSSTPSSTGPLSADNLSGVDPLLVNQAGYDYHLQMGSPARGMAVPPGSADAFSLVPDSEYVHPASHVARGSANDLGAFEFGTPMTGTGGAGGGGPGAGGNGQGAGSGSGAGQHGPGAGPGGAGGGSGAGGDESSVGGCGCRAAGDGPAAPLAVVALLAAASLRRRRARRV